MKQLITVFVFGSALLLTSAAFAQQQRGNELEAAPQVQEGVSCEGPCAGANGQTGTKQMEDGVCWCVIDTESEAAAPERTAAPAGGEAPQERAHTCTQAGCNNACAPNTCAGYRATATGCRYSCILDSVNVRGPN